MYIRRIAFAVTLLVGLSSLRADVRVTMDGQTVSDAELCGFRASRTDTPFHQFLGSDEVVCGRDLAPGVWNVFARRGSAQVSGHIVLIDNRKKLPDIELRLEPAASLLFPQTEDGSFGVAYVTDTLSAFPAGSDHVALVPRNRSLVPLLARDGNPLAVGEPVILETGARRSVTFGPGSSRAVATWLLLPSADAETVRTARRKEVPHVYGTSGREKVDVLNPVRGTILMNGAMQFFRGVPEGLLTVGVSGSVWKPQSKTVDVGPEGVVVTATPLMLIPTSSAIVSGCRNAIWSI